MYLVQSKNRVFFYTGEGSEGVVQVEALMDHTLAYHFDSKEEAQLVVDSLATFQSGYCFQVVEVSDVVHTEI